MSAMLATATNPLRVGLRQERVIAPQCLVIFGASGDLTHRKLVPALFELFRQRRLPSAVSYTHLTLPTTSAV